MSLNNLHCSKVDSCSEAGAITIFFLMLVAVVIGAISLSVYIGQIVERRLRGEIVADQAAMASAGQAAQGLNMIAADNLAIAASIHIAGSLQVISMYGGVAYATSYTLPSYVQDLESMIEKGTTLIQSEVFDRFGKIAGIYIKSAAGMTELNAGIAKYWMATGTVRGLEVGRLNLPGSIVVPMQATNSGSGLAFKMSYQGLKQAPPDNTLCHAIRSSDKWTPVEERNNPLTWLMGPIYTFDNNVADGVFDTITKITTLVSDTIGIHFGFVECGSGLDGPLWNFFSKAGDMMANGADANVANRLLMMKQYSDAYNHVKPDVGSSCMHKLLDQPVYDPRGFASQEKCDAEQRREILATDFKPLLEGLASTATLRNMAKRNIDHQARNEKLECLPYFSVKTNQSACFNPGILENGNNRWLCPLWHNFLSPTDGLCGARALVKIEQASCWRKGYDANMSDATCADWDDFTTTPDKKHGTQLFNWGLQAQQFLKPTSDSDTAAGVAAMITNISEGIPGNLMKLIDGNFDYGPVRSRADKLIEKAQKRVNPSSADHPDRLTQVGFLLIDSPTIDTYGADFEQSRHFASLILNPIRTSEDFAGAEACPSELQNTTLRSDGSTVSGCDDIVLTAFGRQMHQDDSHDASAAADTLLGSSPTLTGGLEGAIGDFNDFYRTQLTMGQAQAVFEPSHGDPTPQAMQHLMWPAWRPRPAKFSAISRLLRQAREAKGSTKPPSAIEAAGSLLE